MPTPPFTVLSPDARPVADGASVATVAGRGSVLLVRPGADGWPVLPASPRTAFLTLVVQGDGDVAGASLAGQALATVTVPVGPSGEAPHPFARGADGPLMVPAPPGSRVVAVRLPYGLTLPGLQPDIVLQLQSGAGPMQLALSAPGGAHAITLDPAAARAGATLDAAEAETVPGALQELTVAAQAIPGAPGLLLQASLPPGAAFASAELHGGLGDASFDPATGLATGLFTTVGDAPRMVVRFYALGLGLLQGGSGAAVVGPGRASGITGGPAWALDAKPVALRSGVAAVGTPAPGQPLRWTLTAALSPAGAEQVSITSTLANGQRFDAGFTPVLTVLRGDVPAFTGAITPTVTLRPDGATALAFDVSAVETGVWSLAGTTVEVAFQSTISTLYGSAGGLVGQGDVLGNAAVLRATVRGAVATDSTDAAFTLPTGSVGLTVHAINGQPAGADARASIGDAVTYRLQAALPLSTARGFTLLASGPGPLGVVSWDAATGVPAPGRAHWGPDGSYTGLVPAITATDGTLRFEFGTLLPVQGAGPGTLDLLYTTRLTATDPGATAAEAWLIERNATGAIHTGYAAATVSVEPPVLRIQAASLYASNDAAYWTGMGGPHGYSPYTGQFGGTVSSAGLATAPFRDTLHNVDAGDDVIFVVALENAGGPAFDVLLRNLLPPGFELPPGGADVAVTDGTGTLLATTGALHDASGGLRLATVPGYDLHSGENVVLVTFLLRAGAAMPVPSLAPSTAQLLSYAAEPGGAPLGAATATTEVVSLKPTVSVSVVGATAVLSPGEDAAFDIVVTLPEGVVQDLTLDALLPPGMLFLSATTVAGGNLSFTPPAASGAHLSFGAVANAPDNRVTDADRMVVQVRARAGPVPAGPAAVTATLGASDGGARWTATDGATVSVIGPDLSVAWDAPALAQPGEPRPYAIRVFNAPGMAPALNVRLAAVLPPGLALVEGSVEAPGAMALGEGASATLAHLGAGESFGLTFRAAVLTGAANGADLGILATATADVQAASGLRPGAVAVQAAASTRVTAATVSITVPPTMQAGVAATILLTATLPDTASPGMALQAGLPAGLLAVPGSVRVVSSTFAVPPPAVQVEGSHVGLSFGPIGPGAGRSVTVAFDAAMSAAAPLGPALAGAALQTGFSAASATAAVTLANTPPTLAGLGDAGSVTTRMAALPFTGAVLADADAAQAWTLTVDAGAGGRLTPPGGAATSALSLSGALPDLQSALRALVFQPDAGAAGTVAQLTATLADGAGGTASATASVRVRPSVDLSGAGQHFALSPDAGFLTAGNGAQTVVRGEVYGGPVSYLQSQLIYDGADAIVIVAQAPNVFIKSFSGYAAIQVQSGQNVVDAGPGSNFIVGGTGPDTFFLDGNVGQVVWNTLVGFSPGDAVTVWGWRPGVSSFTWENDVGAPGYTGRTIRADLRGTGNTTASLTFAGLAASATDRFVITPGQVAGFDYLSVVHAG